MRRADVGTRSLAVDLLNRSLLTDLLPVQSARGLGLYALQKLGPLRRAMMREGVQPVAAQPRLMRGMEI
jgi:2-octaprenyl-6-methoxyphenol hydroxylase